MLSDVSQEIEVTDRGCPIGVVDEPGGIGFGVKVEPPGELRLDARNVRAQQFAREQLAFGGLATGIADGTSRAARDGNRMMPEHLKPAKNQQGHEAANVQG